MTIKNSGTKIFVEKYISFFLNLIFSQFYFLHRSSFRNFFNYLKRKRSDELIFIIAGIYMYVYIYIYIYIYISIYKKFITNIYIHIHIYAYKPMFLRRFLHTIAPISPDLFLFINNNFFKSRPTQKMEMRKK